jgi:hypothetical protein
MSLRPSSLRTTLSFAALLLGGAPLSAQLDTLHLPPPPAERLAALEPFFGSYVYTENTYAGMGPWRGTLDVGPAVKGWYVEWTINTRYGPIDRQARFLLTWDERLGCYRAWRFETTPQDPPGSVEGTGRLEGGELVIEWRDVPGPEGRKGTFRDRFRMEGPDEQVIVSEVDPEGGRTLQIGVWRSLRISRTPAR